MKILATINCFTARKNNGNIIFAIAWKNFLDQNKDKINIDNFVFVNNGFPPQLFESLVAPYNVLHIQNTRLGIIKTSSPTIPIECINILPFDTETTYWPIKCYSDQYDFVIRIDHDAFPGVSSLNSMASYIKEHPDLDFSSASNYPRSIEHDRTVLQNLDTRNLSPQESKTWPWLPWKYPTHNSDLFIIRTSFFKTCLEIYQQDKRIQQRNVTKACPFHTNTLKYGEICNLLNYKEDRYPNTEGIQVRIDGSINSDFWTIMCQQKMNMAGIVDEDNKSFMDRNHLLRYGLVLAAKDWSNIKDQEDRSYNHLNNIQAPYFHLGNGYLSEWYFDPFNRNYLTEENFEYFATHFRNPSFGFTAAHYCIIRLLTLSSKNESLINQLNNSMAKVFETCNVDPSSFNSFYQSLIEAYHNGIKDFIT